MNLKVFQKYALSSYMIVECCPLWYSYIWWYTNNVMDHFIGWIHALLIISFYYPCTIYFRAEDPNLIKILKAWHCFIPCMNNEPSSLSILFYFEDCIWNRVTFMRSLLVGMSVWIDPQNLWPARLLNWHWGLVFILT